MSLASRRIDLATILTALFVIMSLPRFVSHRFSASSPEFLVELIGSDPKLVDGAATRIEKLRPGWEKHSDGELSKSTDLSTFGRLDRGEFTPSEPVS